MTIVIAGVPYEPVRDQRGTNAIRELDPRPSQPADAGRMQFAEWRTDGPALTSVEDLTQGYLGVDAPIDIDTRSRGETTLGPLLDEIDLSTYDHEHRTPLLGKSRLGTGFILGGTPKIQPADGQVEIRANSETYAYITRGAVPAKVKIDGLSLQRANIELSRPATSIVLTRAEDASADQEISIATGEGQPYKVLNGGNVGSGLAGDTWITNDEGQGADILAVAPDRAVALSDDKVLGNVLTGTGASITSMEKPSWGTVATIGGVDLSFTSFSTEGNLWVLGTSRGPYMFDVDLAQFFPLIPESDDDTENTRALTSWVQMGMIFGMRDGAIRMSGGRGSSWGVETFHTNTSEIQGYPTAHAPTRRRLFQTIYDEINNNSYLIEWTARQIGDPHPDHEFVPYPIAKFPGVQSRYLRSVGHFSNAEEHPTLMGGMGSNAFHTDLGRGSRDIDDPLHKYAASGTLSLTELRRNPGVIKDIEAFEFTLDDMSQTETITPELTLDGVPQALFDFIPQTTDGFRRIATVDMEGEPRYSGRTIKPSFTFVRSAADTSVSPKLLSPLRVFYRERPQTVRVFVVRLLLTETKSGTRTTADQAEALSSHRGAAPVEIEGLPIEWGRVESVTVTRAAERGGTDGEQDIAEVQISGWSA